MRRNYIRVPKKKNNHNNKKKKKKKKKLIEQDMLKMHASGFKHTAINYLWRSVIETALDLYPNVQNFFIAENDIVVCNVSLFRFTLDYFAMQVLFVSLLVCVCLHLMLQSSVKST